MTTEDSNSRMSRVYSKNVSRTSSADICRICHSEADDSGLFSPCHCSGTLRYVHQSCIQHWIKSSNVQRCELCNCPFDMETKVKPFMEWEPLDLSLSEKRTLLCSVLVHLFALSCVVWSLYVLVHRTAEEVHFGLFEWQFWTKLCVVLIGFSGSVVFMYIQCKTYVNICIKWKAYNRVIYVKNATLKINDIKTHDDVSDQ